MRASDRSDHVRESRIFHAALTGLIREQAIARFRRMARGFRSSRRVLLSCLGVVLGAIWVANAAVSILLRDPAAPETLRRAVPLGLVAYAIWHVLKVVYRRPEGAIEWTPAEQEQLVGRPFTFRQLLAYRLLGIAGAAVFKSLLFLLLLWPDLRMPVVALAGMLAALLLLDLWRMAVETIAWGMAAPTYRRFRCAVAAVAAAGVASALVISMSSPDIQRLGRSPAAIGLVLDALQSVASLRTTWVGLLAELPFQPFGVVVAAETWSWGVLVALVVVVAEVAAAGGAVVCLAESFRRRVALRERDAYAALGSAPAADPRNAPRTSDLPRIRWAAGAGPIAWRQWLGARHHAVSLLMALAVPAVLACLPLVVFDDPRVVALNVVGALAFYSVLLLPSALKLDFRRDLNRMGVLKSLPIRPSAVVFGQLAVPVLVATAFQFAVLGVAVLASPLGIWLIPAAMAVLVPLNVAVFAMDNLIYLLYPYRLNQEGLEIFLRTTLTFTAKGLIFAVAIVAAMGWAIAAARIAQWSASAWGWASSETIFVAGAWCFVSLGAAATVRLLVRVYRRFDPSCDVPA